MKSIAQCCGKPTTIEGDRRVIRLLNRSRGSKRESEGDRADGGARELLRYSFSSKLAVKPIWRFLG